MFKKTFNHSFRFLMLSSKPVKRRSSRFTLHYITSLTTPRHEPRHHQSLSVGIRQMADTVDFWMASESTEGWTHRRSWAASLLRHLENFHPCVDRRGISTGWGQRRPTPHQRQTSILSRHRQHYFSIRTRQSSASILQQTKQVSLTANYICMNGLCLNCRKAFTLFPFVRLLLDVCLFTCFEWTLMITVLIMTTPCKTNHFRRNISMRDWTCSAPMAASSALQQSPSLSPSMTEPTNDGRNGHIPGSRHSLRSTIQTITHQTPAMRASRSVTADFDIWLILLDWIITTVSNNRQYCYDHRLYHRACPKSIPKNANKWTRWRLHQILFYIKKAQRCF